MTFYFSLCCVLAFFVVQLLSHYHSLSKQQMTIFASSKASVINLLSSTENVVITSDIDEAKRLAEVFWLKNRAKTPLFIADSLSSQTAFVFNDERFLVLSNSVPRRFRNQQKFHVDNLIISRKLYVDSLLFSRFEALKSVTTTANMPTYTRRRINCE